MKTVKPTNSLPWNKGKLVGQKSPLRLRDIWGIRIRLELAAKVRDLALFDLAIDSKQVNEWERRHPPGTEASQYQHFGVYEVPVGI
jgi:hypothetical protein